MLWETGRRIHRPQGEDTPHGSYRIAVSLCAGHAQQLGGESPPPNLMEVKG
jgi:hypothetical protein